MQKMLKNINKKKKQQKENEKRKSNTLTKLVLSVINYLCVRVCVKTKEN